MLIEPSPTGMLSEPRLQVRLPDLAVAASLALALRLALPPLIQLPEQLLLVLVLDLV